jgi:hypothetical protein
MMNTMDIQLEVFVNYLFILIIVFWDLRAIKSFQSWETFAVSLKRKIFANLKNRSKI